MNTVMDAVLDIEAGSHIAAIVGALVWRFAKKREVREAAVIGEYAGRALCDAMFIVRAINAIHTVKKYRSKK